MTVRRMSTAMALLLAVALVAGACTRRNGSDPATAGETEPPAADADDEERSPPNILLILTDDQREGLEVMPATRRRFVERGTSFENAFVTTPLCCPSRATILTGRYVHGHGVLRNQDGMLIRDSTMVQQRLQERGYRTAFYGKFVNYWDLEESPPGFHAWAITGNDAYYDATWNVDGTVKTVPTYSTTFIGNKGSAFLREAESRDEDPWMMFLSTSAPHGPQTPEDRYARAVVPNWSGNPATLATNFGGKPDYVSTQPEAFGAYPGVREAQLRTLLSVDDMVRKTFDVMNRLDETRNTLAIFISDNGMLWGEFGMTGKTHAYTPSIQVPMMMRWPGEVPRGQIDRNLVANVDIVPTMLDAAGMSTRPTDGYSLLSNHRRRHLFLEYWRSRPFPTPPWRSIRTRRFQYIEYYNRNDDVTFKEYYDLRSDPWQLDNLLADGIDENDPDTGRLSRLIKRYSDCSGTDCP